MNTIGQMKNQITNNVESQYDKVKLRFDNDEKMTLSFPALFTNALDKVNQVQLEADNAKEQFEIGNPNFSIAKVMIASEKSSLSFQTVLQISNKVIRAYREIMNMQI